MRVALVHLRHAASGGTERFLDGLARVLARRGDDVEIVCRRHGDPPDPRVRFATLHGAALGVVRRLSVFDAEVAAYVEERDFDVVVGLGRTTCQDVVRLGGGCHATYLEQAHEATLTPLERLLHTGAAKHRRILALETRALAPGAYQRVIVNAHVVADDVVERYGVPRERIEVLHNGVDLERFHPRRKATDGARVRRGLGIGERERVLLFLGNGYGRKGLDLVLEAFPRIARARPGWHLVVVGDDSGHRTYERRARSSGVAERIHFAGPRSDVEAWFAAADLYALPTRYDPFANSTLEAMASGVPVVTTDANGGSEVLSPAAGTVLALERLDAPGGGDVLAAELASWNDPDRLAAGSLAARADAERHPIEGKLDAAAAVLDSIARANVGHPARERFASRLAELGLTPRAGAGR